MGGGEKCAARDNPHVACPVAQPPHANVRIQPKAQQQTAHPRQQKVLSDLAAAFHEVRGCLFVCVCVRVHACVCCCCCCCCCCCL